MFKSLYLRNFKCFSEFEKPIDFTRVNILAGSNGRGKSSIFQSILALAQSYESGKSLKTIRLTGDMLSMGNFKDVIYKGDISKSFTIVLTTDNSADNELKFVCRSNDGVECSFDNVYVKDVPLISEMAMGSDDGKGEEVTQEFRNNSVNTTTYESFSQLANVYYISADRMGPRNSVKMLTEKVADQIGIHGENVINRLYDGQYEFQDKVQEIMSNILEGASIRVTNSPDYEEVKILLDSVDNSVGYKPMNVGFGYSYILPLVVLPLIVPNGSKLFIENPEAHLHPGAQSRLLRFLIKMVIEKRLQLFIETHSEHIINGMRKSVVDPSVNFSSSDATIYFVKQYYNQPEIEKITIDDQGNLSDFPVDFFDQQRQDLFDIMQFAHKRK